MRVLVTRPAHSGERTAQHLRELGHEPLLLPLARPVHDPDAALNALESTSGPIAVTSAEAVRSFLPLGEALRPHLSRPLFAVGEATADEARKLGFRSVTAALGDGRELAKRIEAENPQSLLYLAGKPRAETFEAALHELALPVSVVECYRMEPVERTADELTALVADRRPDAILFYSRQTAANFFRIPTVESLLLQNPDIRLLCLSEAVADAIPARLKKNLAISPRPDEKSLLSLV